MSSTNLRKVGSQGLVAPPQGLGTMGMTAFYKPEEGKTAEQLEKEHLETIAKYVELTGGHAFLDTAWVYKNETAHNETLVGKAIAQHGRDKIILATKFGIDFAGANPYDSSEPTLRRMLGESLQRLGTDHIDLYYQHRQDPNTPIEKVAETIKALIKEGKVKYRGVSEVTAEEIRRAHAVCPLTAIQMEWSLQTRDIEAKVVPTARELGIAIVPYSPLGRGFLSQTFKSRSELPADDWRLTQPRFSEENIKKNVDAVEKLAAIAKRKNVTVGQLALAWVHAQGEDVFPIPGTKSAKRVEENFAAWKVKLTPEEVKEIESAVPEAEGERYHSSMSSSTFNARDV